MAHGLMRNELAQTGAECREGSRPQQTRAPSDIENARFSANSDVAPVTLNTGAEPAQTGANRRSAEAVRQCASYPPKGGLTGRSPAHAPASEPDWRNDGSFDLSQAWAQNPQHTAQILADTFRTAQDGSDREPIRAHYRNTRDHELRGVIAFLMGAA